VGAIAFAANCSGNINISNGGNFYATSNSADSPTIALGSYGTSNYSGKLTLDNPGEVDIKNNAATTNVRAIALRGRNYDPKTATDALPALVANKSDISVWPIGFGQIDWPDNKIIDKWHNVTFTAFNSKPVEIAPGTINGITQFKLPLYGRIYTQDFRRATMGIDVALVWDDFNNKNGVRPGPISIKLFQNGGAVPYETALVPVYANYYSFSVPKYDANGTAYSYSLDYELPASDYDTVLSGDVNGGFTITSKLRRQQDIEVTVIWDDNTDLLGRRPSTITVGLFRNGTAFQAKNNVPVIAAPANQQTVLFTDVDKYDAAGNIYTYTAVQQDIPGGVYSKPLISGLTVTNRVGTNDITGKLILGGEAKYNLDDNSILLCPAETWSSGNALYANMLPDNFSVEYEFKIGGGSGADGLVCAFFADSNISSANGGLLNFSNGYGIELDTYQNFNDSPNPHIALIYGDTYSHLISVDDARINDDSWHKINLRVMGNTVTVSIDGDIVIEYTSVSGIDRTNRYMFFAAATGVATNNHYIRNVVIKNL
jgi:hypothetical protein